ncbi:MAG: protein kinase domain-containing protein [Acidobacteriota bacterium]
MKKPTPFGKYYLLERINVGGMAEVFRAKAFGVEGFERLVAVKRILANIAEDKEFIRMFIDEAKLAVQLNHANIAQIFDLGVVDGAYYIALEHVHGRDLRAMFDRCRQLGEPMPVSQACFVVMKVCEGLDYAHNKRDASGRELHLVHRDVSPQNILVSFEGEVKLIDFGIAKAAGKGSKTQAGILKGKFGYMSPEQVRGIPIDRRSDVFSCGIVLYELLTGERLFVGESDFSTLEKVRNVEILPPSTYNRRIPDELERIVLKALAKDPEDRYQNAIDLHDELQAFVYTAGEFYSRKDLAGWMKKTFGREIDEESAKLEGYRQLKPPPELAPQPVATARGTRPPQATATAPIRKSTEAMRAVGATKPPPPPTVGRVSATIQSAPAVPSLAGARAKGKSGADDDLAWDDDELETQIYDNPEDAPKTSKVRSEKLPLASPPATPTPGAHAAGSPYPSTLPPSMAAPPPAPPPPGGPDLSSLVTTGKGWADAKPAGSNGSNGMPAMLAPPVVRAGAPDDPMAAIAAQYAPAHARELSAPQQLVASSSDGQLFAEPRFGASMLRQKSKRSSSLYIAVGGAALAVVVVVVVIAATGGKKNAASAAPEPGSAAVAQAGSAQAPQPAVATDPSTGFDLYVSPAGVTTWRLDGEVRTDRLPSRIRGISPGLHQVAIDAPPGFMGQNQPVTVEAGKAPKVEIVLTPLQITGEFESTPPGATVSLIIDGKREQLGASPQKTPLDPRKTYQVLFEKAGYVSVNRPIVFTGSTDEKIVVPLERTGAVATAAPSPTTSPGPNPGPVTRPEPKTETVAKTEPKAEPRSGGSTDVAKTEAKGGQGTLLLGSKPPCEIWVDGSDSGLHTPQRDLKLSAGKHRITLVNTDFNIKETFAVDIKADQTEKQIKDFSDRLPK